MGKYVFDASTLILLAKSTILRDVAQLMEVLITPAVKMEVLSKKGMEDAMIIQHLLEEGLIAEAKEPVSNNRFEEEFHLGAGEAETIYFALKRNQIVATDDGRAIKACKVLGVRFITAIHCLLYLNRKGVLQKNMALQKLKRLNYYGRYNAEIIKDAKQLLEENENGRSRKL